MCAVVSIFASQQPVFIWGCVPPGWAKSAFFPPTNFSSIQKVYATCWTWSDQLDVTVESRPGASLGFGMPLAWLCSCCWKSSSPGKFQMWCDHCCESTCYQIWTHVGSGCKHGRQPPKWKNISRRSQTAQFKTPSFTDQNLDKCSSFYKLPIQVKNKLVKKEKHLTKLEPKTALQPWWTPKIWLNCFQLSSYVSFFFFFYISVFLFWCFPLLLRFWLHDSTFLK